MYDVIVIGAGASGIATARMIQDAGKKVIVLEAQDRIGGRIRTDSGFAAFPVELGAEFIHGENTVTRRLLRDSGMMDIPAPRTQGMWWSWGDSAKARLSLSPEHQALLDSLESAYEDLKCHSFEDGDVSLADYLRAKGFDQDAIHTADVLLAQTCCASIESLSAKDLADEKKRDVAGEEEFRVEDGYSHFLDVYSKDLNIVLNAPVTEIHRNDTGVTVHTQQKSYQARYTIVTVSIAVLQKGLINFHPPLSAKKQQAIHALKMEAGTKLVYKFDRQLWSDELVYLMTTGLTARWWTMSYGREQGHVIAAYVTADRAKEIDAMPEQEALSLGLKELSVLLNHPSLETHVVDMKRVCWSHNPYIGGAYAHAPVDAGDARRHLAESEGNRLFFAGEATAYDSNPQTVHGAIESGLRVAREILESGI